MTANAEPPSGVRGQAQRARATDAQPNLRELLGVGGHDTCGNECAFITFFYGEVRACPEDCIGKPRGLMDEGGVIRQCPTCHGTGEGRGPGLEQRVKRRASEISAQVMVAQGVSYREVSAGDVIQALREELGTP